MNRTRTAALLGAALSVTVATVTLAGPAEAASRRTVCAETVTVRSTDNQPVGVLYKGEHFDLDHYSPSGAYAVGYAYGGEGPDGNGVAGWVIANTITDSHGHCQAPYN